MGWQHERKHSRCSGSASVDLSAFVRALVVNPNSSVLGAAGLASQLVTRSMLATKPSECLIKACPLPFH